MSKTEYFTILNGKKWYTYKRMRNDVGITHLSVLFGPNNLKDYRTICIYDKDGRIAMFNERYAQYLSLKDQSILKSCTCRECGRLLTAPKSIISGLGPRCREN